jgi:hypothetical protein
MRDKDGRDRKFLAAIQGIDLESDEDTGDITELKGMHAQQDGFGIGLGLGYEIQGE